MSKRMAYRILSALAFTLALACLASSHELIISDQAKLGNGPMLEPGTCRVEVVKKQDSAEVRFFQGGDLVVTAPATLTKEEVKCNNTEVHSEEVNGGQVITKIRLQGSKESLVFKQDIPEAE